MTCRHEEHPIPFERQSDFSQDAFHIPVLLEYGLLGDRGRDTYSHPRMGWGFLQPGLLAIACRMEVPVRLNCHQNSTTSWRERREIQH